MARAGKFLSLWLPVVFWCGLIFFLSSFHKLQVSPVGWQDFITRKTAHFLEYAILFVLFFRGFKNTTNFSSKKNFLMSFLFTVFYALTDEYHQTLVAGRTGRSLDIGIDSLGAAFGGLAIRKIPNKVAKILKLI